MRTRRLTVALAALAATAMLPADALAQGCAMCRTALQGQDDPLAVAINTSILFLVTMPYLIVGTVGGWIYLQTRRQAAGLVEPGAPADAGQDSVEGENP
jgi:hypothetical protein